MRLGYQTDGLVDGQNQSLTAENAEENLETLRALAGLCGKTKDLSVNQSQNCTLDLRGCQKRPTI
jgi:hypothetical protein